MTKSPCTWKEIIFLIPRATAYILNWYQGLITAGFRMVLMYPPPPLFHCCCCLQLIQAQGEPQNCSFPAWDADCSWTVCQALLGSAAVACSFLLPMPANPACPSHMLASQEQALKGETCTLPSLFWANTGMQPPHPLTPTNTRSFLPALQGAAVWGARLSQGWWQCCASRGQRWEGGQRELDLEEICVPLLPPLAKPSTWCSPFPQPAAGLGQEQFWLSPLP